MKKKVLITFDKETLEDLDRRLSINKIPRSSYLNTLVKRELLDIKEFYEPNKESSLRN